MKGGVKIQMLPPGLPRHHPAAVMEQKANFFSPTYKIIQNGLSRQIPFIGNNHIQQQMLPAERSARSDPGLLRLQTHGEGAFGPFVAISEINIRARITINNKTASHYSRSDTNVIYLKTCASGPF